MIYHCYDMSAPIRSMDGKPLALPMEPGQTVQRSATFSHFSISALGSAYEGEDMTYEVKSFRLNLIEKINANVTAVNLNFVEKMLICQLVDRITKAPLIFQRFVEHFENVGIPARMPIQVVQAAPVSVDLPQNAVVLETNPDTPEEDPPSVL